MPSGFFIYCEIEPELNTLIDYKKNTAIGKSADTEQKAGKKGTVIW